MSGSSNRVTTLKKLIEQFEAEKLKTPNLLPEHMRVGAQDGEASAELFVEFRIPPKPSAFKKTQPKKSGDQRRRYNE